MEKKKLAGAVAATAAMFSIGAAPPASAASNTQVVGIEETLTDPNGTEIAYTVTKIVPSADPVAYPVAGQLYEATVMARVNQGTTAPVVPSFNARAAGGANYPALANVSTLSAAPLGPGGTANGKIYFDVVGDVPNSIVYNGGPENLLVWLQVGEPMPGGSTDGGGGGSTDGGGGGSQGVPGSTGSNDTSPGTSGGEIGGEEGGTEGGGGNLDSGGGSGAPSGDTGGGN